MLGSPLLLHRRRLQLAEVFFCYETFQTKEQRKGRHKRDLYSNSEDRSCFVLSECFLRVSEKEIREIQRMFNCHLPSLG